MGEEAAGDAAGSAGELQEAGHALRSRSSRLVKSSARRVATLAGGRLWRRRTGGSRAAGRRVLGDGAGFLEPGERLTDALARFAELLSRGGEVQGEILGSAFALGEKAGEKGSPLGAETP